MSTHGIAPSARKFTRQHWGALQVLLADPDGRVLGIEAPAVKREARRPAAKRSK